MNPIISSFSYGSSLAVATAKALSTKVKNSVTNPVRSFVTAAVVTGVAATHAFNYLQKKASQELSVDFTRIVYESSKQQFEYIEQLFAETGDVEEQLDIAREAYHVNSANYATALAIYENDNGGFNKTVALGTLAVTAVLFAILQCKKRNRTNIQELS